MVKRPLNYLKAIVIVHGKSEKQLCSFIKSKLRLKIEVISDKNGEKSIQITSIMRILNDFRFKSFKNFIREFEDVEIDKKTKRPSDRFKIFIIMDTDDCSESEKKDYISKRMFQEHWTYPYIVPIYNTPNLESVLEESNVKFEKKGDARKKEYIKIFPTEDKYQHREDLQLTDFGNSLKACCNTNMDEFIKFCLSED